jgi:hypothetical protein
MEPDPGNAGVGKHSAGPTPGFRVGFFICVKERNDCTEEREW